MSTEPSRLRHRIHNPPRRQVSRARSGRPCYLSICLRTPRKRRCSNRRRNAPVGSAETTKGGRTMIAEAPLQEALLALLRKTREQRLSEGKLLSEANLTKYYDRFRERFGPTILNSLDG